MSPNYWPLFMNQRETKLKLHFVGTWFIMMFACVASLFLSACGGTQEFDLANPYNDPVAQADYRMWVYEQMDKDAAGFENQKKDRPALRTTSERGPFFKEFIGDQSFNNLRITTQRNRVKAINQQAFAKRQERAAKFLALQMAAKERERRKAIEAINRFQQLENKDKNRQQADSQVLLKRQEELRRRARAAK